ncbi:MAG: hypothetical protein AB7L92_00825 [Alphaproteobacteria bacterium]
MTQTQKRRTYRTITHPEQDAVHYAVQKEVAARSSDREFAAGINGPQGERMRYEMAQRIMDDDKLFEQALADYANKPKDGPAR